MDINHQLTVRIRSFLNSTELINSPTAQELYSNYLEQSDRALQRLLECEVLLQRKQKIEAVILAQQEPNLFELIDSLMFPERGELLQLADLYDWTTPNEIKMESVAWVKQAVSEMDDLRPLLTEFRRIARTDQVKNKLILLREISRIDNGNPEWHTPLMEVENQYLSQLISEAQKSIQNQDYSQLELIFGELKNSTWEVTVPTIVLQKVEKVVQNHREEEARKEATAILDRINSAYGSFDMTALEDALLCWSEYCQQHQYAPSANEAVQLQEASDYLKSAKQKQKEGQDFQLLIEQLSGLMDAGAPLAEVEMLYAKAQASGLEIPLYVSNRVEKYCMDIERARKTAAVIKGIKIIGTAAVVLAVIAGAALWITQRMIENSQAKNLHAVINEGKIEEAQALLKEIETRFPKLAHRPKISQAKADLAALIADEQERAKSFTRLKKEIETLLKAATPAISLKEKLARLEKIAKTEVEKGQFREVKSTADEYLRNYAEKTEQLFLRKIAVVKKYRDEILLLIKRNNLKQAGKNLLELDKVCQEIYDIPELSKDLLADYKDLLKSQETLRNILVSKSNAAKDIANTQEAIFNAENFVALEDALRTLKQKLDSASAKEESGIVSACLKEMVYFKAIMNYQSDFDAAIPQEHSKTAFFADTKNNKEYKEKTEAVKNDLVSSITSLQRNTNRQPLLFIRAKAGEMFIDIYAEKSKCKFRYEYSYFPGETIISFRRSDGVLVEMAGKAENFKLKMGDEEYAHCSLVSPREFSVESFENTYAHHQFLIRKINSEIRPVKPADIFRTGLQYLKLITEDDQCAPYWKMKLSLRLLDPLMAVDLSEDKQLETLQQKLKAFQSAYSGTANPLYDSEHAEKIQEFYQTYDFSFLDKKLRLNDLALQCRALLKKSNLQCIGIAMKFNGKFHYGICGKQTTVSKDVYCFDEQTFGIRRIGYYDSNDLILDKRFQKYAENHLLLTLDTADAIAKFYHGLRQEERKIKVQSIIWPEFWPLNMRGEEK